MPGAHREGDLRFCGANTVNVGNSQSTVFVNGRLWATEGCPNDHATSNTANGALISIYGQQNIFIGNLFLRAIVGIGDSANTDGSHPFPPTDPLGASSNVICYDAEIAGTAI